MGFSNVEMNIFLIYSNLFSFAGRLVTPEMHIFPLPLRQVFFHQIDIHAQS